MSVIGAILDLLYPPRCAFCHRLMDRMGDGVCPDCRKRLPYTGPIGCAQKPGNIERYVSPLYYERTVRDSLHRFKFSHMTGYAGIYAGFMVKAIDENGFSCDSITWAPVSRKRLLHRGYDQSKLIAEKLAAHYGLPCEKLIKKIRDTKPQSLMPSAAARMENVKGAYAVAHPESVRGKCILLIDDIITSGSTLSECARLLKETGAKEVYAATVARTRN